MSDCTHLNARHQAPGSTIWTCLDCGAAVWDDAQEAFEAMQKRNDTAGLLAGVWDQGFKAAGITDANKWTPNPYTTTPKNYVGPPEKLNDAYRAWRRYCEAIDDEPTSEVMRIWQEGWLFAQEEEGR